MTESEQRQRDDGSTLSAVIAEVSESGEGEEVSLGEIVADLSHRSYGALILVPAILVVSPLSSIPGFSSLAAVVIALVAGQMLIGRPAPWLPGFLTRRRIDHQRLTRATGHLQRVARVVDRLVGPRLEYLTTGPFARAVAAICLVMALVIPPLEIVPMASSLICVPISLFGLSLAARDGALAIVALAIAVVGGGAATIYIL